MIQYGRIELCINGTWGTICNDFWDNEDASVLCGELGYSPYGMSITELLPGLVMDTLCARMLLRILIKYIGAIALAGNFSNLPIHIHDIYCYGNETSIFNCSYNTMNNYCSYRYHYHAAAVICQCRCFRSLL